MAAAAFRGQGQARATMFDVNFQAVGKVGKFDAAPEFDRSRRWAGSSGAPALSSRTRSRLGPASVQRRISSNCSRWRCRKQLAGLGLYAAAVAKGDKPLAELIALGALYRGAH